MIDLVVLGRQQFDWPLGAVYCADPTPPFVAKVIEENLPRSDAEAWLFWDADLEAPDPEVVQYTLTTPGDVWHSGLLMGLQGRPAMIDYVHPTWMLNRDPASDIEATSWRLSFRACLLRTEVLRQMGGPRPEFRTLEAAALEMGHRYIQRGVFLRHTPDLLPAGVRAERLVLPAEDEVRFIFYRFGRKWANWALLRALLTRYRSRRELLQVWRQMHAWERPSHPHPFSRPFSPAKAVRGARVTVLIPTLQRYPYLYTLLDQLRTQTVPPHEVIIVDQTPREERDKEIAMVYPDLPLDVIYQDEPGQCTSRNAGIQRSTGDWILLLDDDVEIRSDLIEQHLLNCARFGAEVSSGVAEEVGAGLLPLDFRHVQVSSVFPAGNTLVHRRALVRSGLFDLAYNRGQRADGDLGMRIYLSGAVMVLNPSISVLHHRAPRGGLREHKARTITYASSRQRLMHRQLPSATEVYLAHRYFGPRQVREMVWLKVLGTFSVRGRKSKKLLKIVLDLLLLPNTLWQVRQRYNEAQDLLWNFPQIPNRGNR